jgi:hypothetical protein
MRVDHLREVKIQMPVSGKTTLQPNQVMLIEVQRIEFITQIGFVLWPFN